MPSYSTSQSVDIVNRKGKVVGQKLRKDINKSIDLFHSVHIVLITPSHQLVLSQVPYNQELPNLYISQVGSTVATMRRHNESAEQAARRALAKEIYWEDMKLNFVGEQLAELSDGLTTFLTVFYVIGEVPHKFSKQDIASFLPTPLTELDEKVTRLPYVITPTFIFIWENYKKELVTK